jgi:type II secretory ATPase GspE/PulE/Tfp pilus assembly ATPase PilB-like protein
MRLEKIFVDDLTGIKVRGVGCSSCNNGIHGRTVVAEIINCDQKFMELVADSTYEAEKYWLQEHRGIPMMAHGLLKVKAGEVDPRDLEDELEQIKLPLDIDIEYFNSLVQAGNS